jgi:chromosome segregation ATPase
MPSISNDGGPVDYIAYFTKQLPRDLARMAELRDELEKRQGAMMAVDEINAAKAAADKALAQARVEADAITAAAKATLTSAKAKEAMVAEREKAYVEREKAFNADVEVKVAQLAKQEADITTKTAYLERELSDRAAALDSVASKLDVEKRALDIRIQNFQAKVAALSV